MGQIHAAQFVAGSIQMRLDAAERHAENLGGLLVGLSARRPKQTLLFPDRQLDVEGGNLKLMFDAESMRADSNWSPRILLVL
jgi:hypothetical protein